MERNSLYIMTGGQSNTATKAKPGYKLLIDRLEVDSSTILTPGQLITIAAVYTPIAPLEGATSISISVDGDVLTTDGLSIVVPNKEVTLASGGTHMDIVVQPVETGGAVIAPLTVVIPISVIEDNTFYYGVGAIGLVPTEIQLLTKVLSPRVSMTLTFSPTSQVVYFAYPYSYGLLDSIKDGNGFDITLDFWITDRNFTLTPPNLSGATSVYYVYEFKTLTSQPTFHWTFNF